MGWGGGTHPHGWGGVADHPTPIYGGWQTTPPHPHLWGGVVEHTPMDGVGWQNTTPSRGIVQSLGNQSIFLFTSSY